MRTTNGIKIGRAFHSSIDASEDGFKYIIKQNLNNRERANKWELQVLKSFPSNHQLKYTGQNKIIRDEDNGSGIDGAFFLQNELYLNGINSAGELQKRVDVTEYLLIVFSLQRISLSINPVWIMVPEHSIKYEPSIRQEHTLGDMAILYKCGLQIVKQQSQVIDVRT